MGVWPLMIVGVVALAVSYGLIPFVQRFCVANGKSGQDKQVHQIHSGEVPRFGGIAIVAGWLGSIVVAAIWHGAEPFQREATWALVFGPLALFCLGCADDWRHINAKIKLGIQVARGV